MVTKRSRARRVLTAIVALGLVLSYYGQALGALILIECPNLGPNAPGHCAWPYRWCVAGAALTAVGAAGWLAILTACAWRHVSRRLSARQ